MTTVAHRSPSPISEMFDWLESVPSLARFAPGSLMRLEDFVDGETYVVRAELPGVDPDNDIDVRINGDVLTIRGQRREEQRDKNHSEFHYGSFERSIRLPRGTRGDAIVASYTDGVLEVRVPTATPTEATTKIPVQRSATTSEAGGEAVQDTPGS